MEDGPKKRAADSQRIEDEAATRFVALLDTDDPGARAEAFAWIAQSPRHGVAFARAEAAWEAAQRLRAAPPPLEPEHVAGPAGRFEAIFSRRGIVSGLIAAALVAGGATVVVEKITSVERYRTEPGAQQLVRLEDGTRIWLNTASAIEVSLPQSSRAIRLLEGEALFDVPPDRDRPLTVSIGGSVVRSTIGRFSVRVRPDVTELTQFVGSAQVTDGDSRPQSIAAGEGAAVHHGMVIATPLTPGIAQQRIAWTRGMIDLDGASLAQAVDEFNRYREHPLVIGEPRLASLLVSGSYGIRDSARFLALLQNRFPVRAITAADRTVLLVEGVPTSNQKD